MAFVVLRHADTFKNQSINIENFMKVLNKQIMIIIKIIKKNNDKNIVVMASPFERCYDTALIITNMLNLLLKKDLNVKKDENLTRWDKKTESRENSKIRAHAYGEKLSIEKNIVYIFITHSSIIPWLCAGLSNIDIQTFNDKYNEKLYNCGVSYVKDRKIKYYNKIEK